MERLRGWHGALIVLGVELVAAVLYPAFGQHRFSGADKVPTERVARAIQALRRSSGAWPTAFEPLRPAFRSVSPALHQRISFVPLQTDAPQADYAIAVDGDVAAWRIPLEGNIERIGGKSAFGTLNP